MLTVSTEEMAAIDGPEVGAFVVGGCFLCCGQWFPLWWTVDFFVAGRLWWTRMVGEDGGGTHALLFMVETYSITLRPVDLRSH